MGLVRVYLIASESLTDRSSNFIIFSLVIVLIISVPGSTILRRLKSISVMGSIITSAVTLPA